GSPSRWSSQLSKCGSRVVNTRLPPQAFQSCKIHRNTNGATLKQPVPIRAALIGSDRCEAEGILGIPVYRSAGTHDQRIATKITKRIEQEIKSVIHTLSCGPTFLAAAVAYMKAGGDRTFLGPIIEYDGAYAIRDKAVETIAQQDLDHIADALYHNNTAQSRNRQVYTPIIAGLHRAGIERRFKRPKGWQGKKSNDQAFDLLAAADAIDREFGLLCYTLLYTGRRIGDLLNSNTRLSNLNLDNGTLYFGKTKNG